MQVVTSFRQKTGYANVESTERFPHLHSLDGGCEIISESNQMIGPGYFEPR
jgi:hypothetical protein